MNKSATWLRADFQLNSTKKSANQDEESCFKYIVFNTIVGSTCFSLYAHIEVLVTFLLVNFFGFLVITRDHGDFEARH